MTYMDWDELCDKSDALVNNFRDGKIDRAALVDGALRLLKRAVANEIDDALDGGWFSNADGMDQWEDEDALGCEIWEEIAEKYTPGK